MKKPNILIFMTDQQRADSALMDGPTITPHLDNFARKGLAFTEAYCPSPHCCPSRATFMTGLYPSMHGVWNNVANDLALSRGLRPGVRAWSEDLKAAGYRMDFFGRWHVSAESRPSDHGWTEHILEAVGRKEDTTSQVWERARDGGTRLHMEKRKEGQILRPGYGPVTLYGTAKPGTRGEANLAWAERIAGEASEWIEDRKSQDPPWCAYVGICPPHEAYTPRPEYLDMYDLKDIDLPPSYADDLADKPDLYQRMRRQIWSQLSDREVREAIRHYRALCTHVDVMFGQLLKALERSEQAEDTLVIFTSDHGDYCGEHGFFCKSLPCFRGAYHVPMVMRWPNGIPSPGRIEDAFVSLADVGPTLLDLAGVRTDRHFGGASLVSYLRGQRPASWRDAVFTQSNGVEIYANQRSVMTQQHKYVFNAFGRDELYDRTIDPEELTNRADDPAYAEVKAGLLQRLWQFAKEQHDAMAGAGYVTIALAPLGPAAAFASPSAAVESLITSASR